MKVLGRVFRVWTNAAVAVFPIWWLFPGARKSWSQKILVRQMPWKHEAAEDALSGLGPGQLVDISLSKDCFLVRQVDVPKTAKERTMGILDLNLRQAMPNQAGQVIWRAAKSNTRIEVGKGNIPHRVYSQFVVKKEHIKTLEDQLNQRGLKLRSVTIDRMEGVEPLVDNRSSCDRPAKIWWAIGLSTLAVGVVVWIAIQYSQLAKAKTAHEALVAENSLLAEQVVAAIKQKEQISLAYNEVLGAVDSFNSQANPLRILAGVTRALDDNVWVSEFSLSGNLLTLAGFTSSEVSEVIESLRGIEWVESAQIAAPVALDRRTMQSRFDIRIDLKNISK